MIASTIVNWSIYWPLPQVNLYGVRTLMRHGIPRPWRSLLEGALLPARAWLLEWAQAEAASLCPSKTPMKKDNHSDREVFLRLSSPTGTMVFPAAALLLMSRASHQLHGEAVLLRPRPIDVVHTSAWHSSCRERPCHGPYGVRVHHAGVRLGVFSDDCWQRPASRFVEGSMY